MAILPFTSPSLSPTLCPAIPLCFILPTAVFEMCGVPWSCGNGGSCSLVPSCKVSIWATLKEVICTWLSEVFSGLVHPETRLGELGAVPQASWPGSMCRQMPLMLVTHTVPLLVPPECLSVSFPYFSLWLSGKEGSLPSLQGRANSKLAHPSLLMSGASCG